MNGMTISSTAATLALALSSSVFAATAHQDEHTSCGIHASCETTLTFSEVLSVRSTMAYSNVAGSGLVISATGGKLVDLLGELGVASATGWDPRVNAGESIVFTFAKDVQLKSWKVDDLALGGSGKFSLSVDGGAAQRFSLGSTTLASALTGHSFIFGYSGDKFMIDTLKFSSVSAPVSVTSVPEPESYALVVAGLFTLGAVARRRTTEV